MGKRGASNTRRRLKSDWRKKQLKLEKPLKSDLSVALPGSCFLRRARQAETASHINKWLTSPGLQPPQSLENLFADQKE
jgi:hypothetical protein